MRIISQSNLIAFAMAHPKTRAHHFAAMAKTDQGSELGFDQRLTGGDWRGDPQWRAREV